MRSKNPWTTTRMHANLYAKLICSIAYKCAIVKRELLDFQGLGLELRRCHSIGLSGRRHGMGKCSGHDMADRHMNSTAFGQ
jgi:hypothetical protein